MIGCKESVLLPDSRVLTRGCCWRESKRTGLLKRNRTDLSRDREWNRGEVRGPVRRFKDVNKTHCQTAGV